jgi:hypothetical protein
VRTTTSATQAQWASGDYVGTARPMVRATIQKLNLMCLAYANQIYTSVPFGQASKPLELPNIKDVKWKRSVDGNVASMDMTLYNTEPLPIGRVPSNGDLDQPGFYSPLRGNTAHSDRWSRTRNGWQDWIVPDRIIRTYEGYGFNPAVAPEVDPHLYQSGVWRIDDVTFTTDGLITVSCRDIGSILLDQILFPPVVPFANYPIWFQAFGDVPDPPVTTATSGWVTPAYDNNSNVPWVGNGTPVNGHVPGDAFDANWNTYWLSIGNGVPDGDYSFEWIQGKFSSRTLAGGELWAWGGPYVVYVSVYAGGYWHGDQTVPYNPRSPVAAPNGSDIRYVSSFRTDENGHAAFTLPSAYANATKMRLTFTNLYNSGIGPYKYRAGVRSFKVCSTVTHTTPGGFHVEPATEPPGIWDYTDIVKIFCAWAGFHWPREAVHAFRTFSNGTTVATVSPSTDRALVNGRVWGDFEETGTYPKVAIPVPTWDKIPVMDGIKKVADIVGFLFFVDDTGGVVFRSPNIWKVGNVIGDGGPSSGRTTTIVEIDERTTLMNLSATMSSRSIREKIFVANISGQIAAMANGHNPYPSGLRRVGGWTDQHFQTVRECQIMADLITLRQLFTYRTDKITIPGNPAIQVDDQVRVYERISEEVYLHYVIGISMSWSLETGKYVYDLDTHWLGDSTFDNWTFNPAELSAEAQQYLRSIGKIP